MERGGVLDRADAPQPERRAVRGHLHGEGRPNVIGMVEMDYIRSDPKRGHLYRCRREGVSPEDPAGRPVLRGRVLGEQARRPPPVWAATPRTPPPGRGSTGYASR